jgi:hypothetical protein
LESAISHILQACNESKENENTKQKKKPFFFLVGAGISHPNIPLAPEIERDCKRIANDYGREQ